ncbi:Gingipain R2 [subsurface metagenome]
MRLLSILVLVLLAISNLGLVEAARTPAIKVIQDNGSSITIEFKLQGYEIEQIDVNGVTCSSIKLPGQVTYLEKGLPELPTIARNIIIPDDALMDYRIVNIEYDTKKINPVVPSKGNLYRDINPDDIAYTFDKFYQTDSWWPKNTVEIHEPFILRDYRGLTVRFNPFQYNPAKNELKIVKRLVVEIYEISKGGANIITKKKDSITREFVNIYESIFLNFNQARYDSISEQAGRMVIICADAYISNMQDFKEWKRMKGIETKMVPISSIGNTEPNIKAFIQDEYDAGDLVWIHLVGDGNEIVPATGTVGGASGA